MIKDICADLIRKNITVSVAESFTGGNVAAKFVENPGISKIFLAGIVAYSNDAKHKLLGVPLDILSSHGAVSAECAVSMAECARINIGSNIGLSTTGFAGPRGDNDNHPVGTYFVAISTAKTSVVRKYFCNGSREEVTEAGINSAFELLNEFLNKF